MKIVMHLDDQKYQLIIGEKIHLISYFKLTTVTYETRAAPYLATRYTGSGFRFQQYQLQHKKNIRITVINYKKRLVLRSNPIIYIRFKNVPQPQIWLNYLFISDY